MEYVVTGAFVAFFLWVAGRRLYLRWRGCRTTGTITSIVLDKASDGSVYNLVVQFTTATGATIEAQSFFGFENVNTYYRIGERVSILYSPKNPRVFAIEGDDGAGVFVAFLVAAGAGGIFYWGFLQATGH